MRSVSEGKEESEDDEMDLFVRDTNSLVKFYESALYLT
jgi:hypothetical protein